MRQLGYSLPIGAFLVGLAVADVSAQVSGTSFPVVFGGAADGEASPSLDGTLSVFEAYEDNGNDATDSTVFSPYEVTGSYTSLQGALSYQRQGPRVQFGTTAGAEARYYTEQSTFIAVNQYAGVGINASFPLRTTVAVTQTVSYSPAYFAGQFPALSTDVLGAVDAPGGEMAVSDLKALSLETSASVGRGVSRYGTLNFNASLRNTLYDDSSGYDDLRSYAVGGRYVQRVSPHSSLRLGYVYRRGQYGFVGSSPDAAVHDLDVGVDYGRALSVARRTQLDFSVGSAIVTLPAAGVIGSQLQYQVLGNAGLNHQIGRTWRARFAYNRGLGFVAGLPQPVFSDGMTASLNGFFNSRADLTMTAAYTDGNVGTIDAPRNEMTSYSGTTRLRVGLTRTWAAMAEYFFYHYDIGTGVLLPAGVQPFHDRTGISVGLTLWLPLSRS